MGAEFAKEWETQWPEAWAWHQRLHQRPAVTKVFDERLKAIMASKHWAQNRSRRRKILVKGCNDLMKLNHNTYTTKLVFFISLINSFSATHSPFLNFDRDSE